MHVYEVYHSVSGLLMILPTIYVHDCNIFAQVKAFAYINTAHMK